MHIICSHMCSHSIVEECDETAWFIKHVSGKTGDNGPLSSIISNNGFNLLCMNYNVMHFTSNTEIVVNGGTQKEFGLLCFGTF